MLQCFDIHLSLWDPQKRTKMFFTVACSRATACHQPISTYQSPPFPHIRSAAGLSIRHRRSEVYKKVWFAYPLPATVSATVGRRIIPALLVYPAQQWTLSRRAIAAISTEEAKRRPSSLATPPCSTFTYLLQVVNGDSHIECNTLRLPQRQINRHIVAGAVSTSLSRHFLSICTLSGRHLGLRITPIHRLSHGCKVEGSALLLARRE